MFKKILLVFAVIAAFFGFSSGTVLAKGPTEGTNGYEMYKLHAGDGTHADDPLDIVDQDGGLGTGTGI